ncbi:VOC family protein [Terriglobus tenax]|uniref:VOC family protein n=1 Tax=Terriglobus tenax TaxID=1111115 RepID=UPI0021E07FAF|nr:VOC family protein [Terriglobus tenax]
MSSPAAKVPSTVIPGMRYRDCLAAIEWLCTTLGFEKQAVYMSADGIRVDHAQLTFGNGMIMLGSEGKEGEYAKYAAMPDELGGREVRSVSLIVTDCVPVYEQAKSIGAQIVFDLEEKPYGGKAFTCRDPEGYLWHVGEYNPWA